MMIVLGYLTIVSVCSTCYISEYEHVFFVKDQAVLNCLWIILAITAAVLAKKYVHISDDILRRIEIACLITLTFILLYFVFSSQLKPIYDQNKIFQIAGRMYEHDYIDFVPSGYAQRCDNQWGILLFLLGIFKLFGNQNLLILQIINVISIIIAIVFIPKICDRAANQRTGSLIGIVLCFFIPLWGYATFIYGTLPSYALAITACYFLIVYIEEHKIKDAVLMGLCIGAAITLKTNSVIFWIAIMLFLLLQTILQKRPRILLSVLWLVIVYFGSAFIVNQSIASITELPHEGLPRTAQMAMSLQDNSMKTSGWYNGYMESVYEENGYLHNQTNQAAVENIKASLEGFIANPSYAAGFFVRKIVSQWNEPTFESLFIQTRRESLVEPPGYLDLLLHNNQGNPFVTDMMDVMQTLILFGAFFFFLNDSKNRNVMKYLPAVIILGGFFFHIIWEANSQYIITYFILLIPYAVLGYLNGSDCVCEMITVHSAKNRFFYEICIFIGLVLVINVLPQNDLTSVLKPHWNDEEYAEYRSEYEEAFRPISYGRYFISPYDANDEIMGLPEASAEEGTSIELYTLDSQRDDRVLISPCEGGYHLRRQESQLVFDVAGGVVEPGGMLQQWRYIGEDGQVFHFADAGDDAYFILCGERCAVTYDQGSRKVKLEEFIGKENQMWRIRKNREKTDE